jgi:tetratricopeptide (TPR) repeat protein
MKMADGGGFNTTELTQNTESKDGGLSATVELFSEEVQSSGVDESNSVDVVQDAALSKAQEHAEKLIKNKKYRVAIKFLKGWLGKYPDDPSLLLLQGRALVGIRNHKAAVVQFEKAIEADSDLTEAYFELGNAYMKVKKKDEACKAFGDFLTKDTESPRADAVVKKQKKLKCP